MEINFLVHYQRSNSVNGVSLQAQHRPLCKVHPHAPTLLHAFSFLAVSDRFWEKPPVSIFFFLLIPLTMQMCVTSTHPASLLWVSLFVQTFCWSGGCPSFTYMPAPPDTWQSTCQWKTTRVACRHLGVRPYCYTLHCHCHSWVQATCDANREDALPGLGRAHGVSGVMSASTRLWLLLFTLKGLFLRSDKFSCFFSGWLLLCFKSLFVIP